MVQRNVLLTTLLTRLLLWLSGETLTDTLVLKDVTQDEGRAAALGTPVIISLPVKCEKRLRSAANRLHPPPPALQCAVYRLPVQ